jgi:selenocysteine-specific elongation factor
LLASLKPASEPLTLGTAGHVDHGKTALVARLTGVDTDRLPEEKARGLTIVLGYAPLSLPSGRRLSIVDVPGHERFVRTMVAGASGVDLFLLAIAADDGVMPQTVEHVAVLRALGVEHGLVAVTKCDIADPSLALAQAAELVPGAAAVACSVRTGAGLDDLLAQLDALAATRRGRACVPGPARLHIDRVFTVRGRGTVVTGTLWSGAITQGSELELAPKGLRVRVRGVQVHDAAVASAVAGQRVAVNLSGVRHDELDRGDALADPGTVAPTCVLDCALQLREAPSRRVQVHHGTRAVAGRAVELGDGLWQLRLERPLLACDGDRVVVRRLAPPDTLGGGVVLDAAARRHGRRGEIVARLAELRSGRRPARASAAAPAPQRAARPEAAQPPDREHVRDLAALEQRLLAAGAAMLSEAQAGEQARLLGELCRAGAAVRVSGRLYAHAQVEREIRRRILALLEREGSVTLAGARDALELSRKSAQAFLERLDSERVTRRLPDDRRVLAASRGAQGDASA